MSNTLIDTSIDRIHKANPEKEQPLQLDNDMYHTKPFIDNLTGDLGDQYDGPFEMDYTVSTTVPGATLTVVEKLNGIRIATHTNCKPDSFFRCEIIPDLVYKLDDGSSNKITIEITDNYGNSSSIDFPFTMHFNTNTLVNLKSQNFKADATSNRGNTLSADEYIDIILTKLKDEYSLFINRTNNGDNANGFWTPYDCNSDSITITACLDKKIQLSDISPVNLNSGDSSDWMIDQYSTSFKLPYNFPKELELSIQYNTSDENVTIYGNFSLDSNCDATSINTDFPNILPDKTLPFVLNYSVLNTINNSMIITQQLNGNDIVSDYVSYNGAHQGINIDDKLFYSLPLNKNNTITLNADDGSGAVQSVNVTFVRVDAPPIISGKDDDLGSINKPFTLKYSILDTDKDDVSVVVTINDVTVDNKQVSGGKGDLTLDITQDMINEYLGNSKNTIVIAASDASGLTAMRTYTFVATENIAVSIISKNNAYVNFKCEDSHEQILIARVYINGNVVKTYNSAFDNIMYYFNPLDFKEGTNTVMLEGATSSGSKSIQFEVVKYASPIIKGSSIYLNGNMYNILNITTNKDGTSKLHLDKPIESNLYKDNVINVIAGKVTPLIKIDNEKYKPLQFVNCEEVNNIFVRERYDADISGRIGQVKVQMEGNTSIGRPGVVYRYAGK